MRLSALLALFVLTAPSAWSQTQPSRWTNSLGMVFVRIPAGSFWMGSAEPPERLARDFPQLEPQRFSKLGDEAPVHRVRITRAFWLASTR